MTESKFTASLRALLKDYIYVLKISTSYARGVPDCFYSGSKEDLWNEHKYLQKLPPVIEPMKLLSKLQSTWLLGRHAEGRNVAVIIGSTEGHVLLRDLTWVEPLTRDEFREYMMTKQELASLLITELGEVAGDILP